MSYALLDGVDVTASPDQCPKWMRLVVTNRTLAAQDIVVFELKDPNGGALPPFTCGAHLDLRLPNGLVRQYSICSDPADQHRYRLAVLLEPASRGGSAAVHAGLADGAVVEVGTPRNLFQLAQGTAPVILLAGGIGVTPLLAMAYSLNDAGRRFELHYSVRTRNRAAFLDELERGDLASHLRLHLDDGPPDQRLDLGELLEQAAPDSQLYVCGPAGFINFVMQGAKCANWPEDQLHSERFDADIDLDGEAFEIIAERSGRRLIVPKGKSAAEVLLAAGLDIAISCEQGICGTCLCDVIEGVPDHRDLVQSEAEKASNRQMALCCSRARTPVIRLDI